MDGTDIKPGFRACSLCTHTCYNEHGYNAAKTPDSQLTRPPCFLTTAVEALKPWMPIPKEFVDAHGERFRGSVDLEGPNGRVWLVYVGGAAGGAGFRNGWKSFVANNNLKRGDQLLFSLVADNRFFVYVFNRLGIETISPSTICTKTHLPVIRKRKRHEREDEVSDESEDESSESSEYEASKSDAEPLSEPEYAQGSSRAKREKLDNELKTTNGNGPVRGKVTSKATSNPDKKKPAPGLIKKECPQEPGWNSTTYESQRRQVTDAERERTMEAARSLKTENPSIVVLMKPSHVYRGFWLTIPGKYSREHMPQERIQIKLQDSHGFQWPASWIKSNHHSGVSGGWAAFSRDHCMEEGDVCVFEVIDSQDWTVLVHIFRVVEVDLVPGTRGGWENTYNVVYGPGHPAHGRSQSKALKRRGKKTGSVVKKNLAKALYAESCKGDKKLSSPEDSDDDHGDDDDVPLKNLRRDKATQGAADTNSDEVDVKPKIGSIGLTPRSAPHSAKVKQENGIDCGDIKPTLEQLRASLHGGDVKPTLEQLKASLKPPPPRPCDPFQNFEEKPKVQFPAGIVKPEPVEGEGEGEAPPVACTKVERTWYEVNRLINKRQSKTKQEKEFLVELEGPVVRKKATGHAVQDDSGNWWVPYSQFSPDFARCFID